MIRSKPQPLEQLLEKLQDGLLLWPKQDDSLVLDDATLLAAANRRAPLTRSQWNALLDSPLTLRRLRHLLEQQQLAQVFRRSTGLLRAADGGSGTSVLTVLQTADGFWSLNFLPAGEGWHMVLRMDPTAPFAADLMRQPQPVQVQDGQGLNLLTGLLDADGELEGPWAPAQPPAEHFAVTGGRFAVGPVA